jgi:hypothetical protein
MYSAKSLINKIKKTNFKHIVTRRQIFKHLKERKLIIEKEKFRYWAGQKIC